MHDNQVSNMRPMSYIPVGPERVGCIRGDGIILAGLDVFRHEGQRYVILNGRAVTADDLRQLADAIDAIDIERDDPQPKLPLD